MATEYNIRHLENRTQNHTPPAYLLRKVVQHPLLAGQGDGRQVLAVLGRVHGLFDGRRGDVGQVLVGFLVRGHALLEGRELDVMLPGDDARLVKLHPLGGELEHEAAAGHAVLEACRSKRRAEALLPRLASSHISGDSRLPRAARLFPLPPLQRAPAE